MCEFTLAEACDKVYSLKYDYGEVIEMYFNSSCIEVYFEALNTTRYFWLSGFQRSKGEYVSETEQTLFWDKPKKGLRPAIPDNVQKRSFKRVLQKAKAIGDI